MLKIIVWSWHENQKKLRDALSQRTDLSNIDYIDLVKLAFEVVYNNSPLLQGRCEHMKIDLEKISTIDNGDYQGTLLFVLPFDSYQPSEHEYLMTYVGYGSCCGCDTLQAIQGCCEEEAHDKLDEFVMLCKDILANTVKPFNSGWRKNELFEQFEGEV